MIRQSLEFLVRLIRPQLWTLILFTVTGVLCVVVAYLIVWPAYQNPISRMYTSKLGYSTVIRKTGGAFPVDAAKVETRTIVGKVHRRRTGAKRTDPSAVGGDGSDQ